MPSLLPGFEYDIFISYRQKDNKGDHWVTEFVNALKAELEATFKEDVSIYFDENPHDGLLETHQVDKSLEGKLKCLIFIPIISQTYCDPKSFAWQQEFCAFNKLAKEDSLGRDIRLGNGNVASRILPIKIHDLDAADKMLLEQELGGMLRAVEFIYREPGINRPLRAKDDNVVKGAHQVFYRDHVNKVANAIKGILDAMMHPGDQKAVARENRVRMADRGSLFWTELKRRDIIRKTTLYLMCALLAWKLAEVAVKYFEFPGTLVSTVLLSLVGLFPIFLALTWSFELGPNGFVRYSPVAESDTSQNTNKGTRWKDYSMLALVLAYAVLVLMLNEKEKIGSSPGVSHVSRFEILTDAPPESVVISEDGTKIAYRQTGQDARIFYRDLNESEPRVLDGTWHGYDFFFSPDGSMIAYFLDGALYKTSLKNSQPLKIADVPGDPRGGIWTDSDTILISWDFGLKLGKVPVSGGSIVLISPGREFSRPSRIPGTDVILGSDENYDILALSLRTGEVKQILPCAGWQPRFLEPGYLVYAVPGRLLIVPFDKNRMEITGASVPVLGDLCTSGLYQTGIFDVTATGTLIYSTRVPHDKGKFVWVDEGGTLMDSLSLPDDFYGAFSLSPDETRLAYGMNGPKSDIWVFDLLSGQNRKLTTNGTCQYPIWNPDGQRVTYSSLEEGNWDLYQQDLNSTARREMLTRDGSLKRPGSWSPDGKLLTFYKKVPGEGSNTFLLSLEEGKITSPWHNTRTSDNQPRFSPDGRFVCYYTGDPGQSTTYVEPFPPTGERWPVSIGHGVDAIWSSDGKKLFYTSSDYRPSRGESSIFAVQISLEGKFSSRPPKLMFSGPFFDVFDKSFNVSKDGKRFLMLRSAIAKPTRHFEIVLNWVDEIDRQMKKQP